MTIFGALLPGLRHLRTPLTCGILITICLYLCVYPVRDDLATTQPAADLWSQLQGLPPLIQLSAFAFLSYLLGVAWEQFVNGVLELVGRRPVIGKVPTLRRHAWDITFPAWLPTARRRVLTDPKIDRFVRETISRQLNTARAERIGDLIPKEFVINDFRETAFGISDTNSVVYQDWDRLVNETEFRRAATPLIFSYVVPTVIYLGGWALWTVLTVVLLITTALAFSAITSAYNAASLIATALYQDVGKSPALSALYDEMRDIEFASGPARVAWVLEYLGVQSTLDEDGKAGLRGQLGEYALRHDVTDVNTALDQLPLTEAMNLELVGCELVDAGDDDPGPMLDAVVVARDASRVIWIKTKGEPAGQQVKAGADER